MNEKKRARFELRMPAKHESALDGLAKAQGVTKSMWIKNQIEASAKKAKLWRSTL